MTSFRFIAEGGYLEGIPARDLDEDEVAALGFEKVDLLVKSGMYAAVNSPKSAPASAHKPSDKTDQKDGD